jgi:hypothetical protein
VAAVVSRRIAQLPERTAATLTAGAAIGREFAVDVLARALGADELALLDVLQPAVDGDLLHDVGGDHYRFGHALARDAAYDSLGPSRRERLHATIAEILEDTPDAAARAPEIARHWAAAGPRHLQRAWRAAARAGSVAMSAHAPDEAAAHLETALSLQSQDPAAGPRDRYDLLVELAIAARWSTRRDEMHRASDEATLIAGGLADPELVVRAAIVPAYDALWPARGYGESNEAVLTVIRETLAGVSTEDSELRCRLLLALASEGYYVSRPEEIDRLVDEAVAIARRLDDPELLAESLMMGVTVLWRPDQVGVRMAMLEECERLAVETGRGRLLVNARCLLASCRSELGEVEELGDEFAELQAVAREERLYFAELIMVCLAHSWAVMRGDETAVGAHLQRISELDELMSMPAKVDTILGALMYGPLWDVDTPVPEQLLQQFLGQSSLPLLTAAVTLFLRHGRIDEARALWANHTDEEPPLSWFSPPYWAFTAEAALGLGDPRIAGEVYTRLRPYSGRCVMSGTNPALGPVDAYLALAAAATGDLALAAQHADRAADQIARWQLPQVEKWFLALRDRHSF